VARCRKKEKKRKAIASRIKGGQASLLPGGTGRGKQGRAGPPMSSPPCRGVAVGDARRERTHLLVEGKKEEDHPASNQVALAADEQKKKEKGKRNPRLGF